jgi:hypothetical protein
MIEASELKEVLVRAQKEFLSGARENLNHHLQAGDLPSIKYAAGQLNGVDIMFQRVFAEIDRLREDKDA